MFLLVLLLSLFTASNIYAIPKPELLHTFEIPVVVNSNRIEAFTFSPDGEQILIASDQKTDIFDSHTCGHIHKLHGSRLAAYRPNSNQFAIMSDDANSIYQQRIQLFDWSTGQEIQTLPYTSVRHFSFSPDGSRIAIGTGSGSSRITVHNLVTSTQELIINPPFTAPPVTCFSNDGTKIVTYQGAPHVDSLETRLLIYDLPSGALSKTLAGHTQRITNALFMPISGHILSTGNDHAAKIWDIFTGEIISEWMNPNPYGIDVTPDEKFILAGRVSENTYILDANTLEKILWLPSEHYSQVKVDLSPDGRRALTLGRNDAKVHYWDIGPHIYPTSETSTETPTQTPPKATPTLTPVPSPTPTFAPSSTPAPQLEVNYIDPNYEVKPLYRNIVANKIEPIPGTDELAVLLLGHIPSPNVYFAASVSLPIPVETEIDYAMLQSPFTHHFAGHKQVITDIAVSDDGWIAAGVTNNIQPHILISYAYENRKAIYIEQPGIHYARYASAIYVVRQNDSIINCKPGDILVLNWSITLEGQIMNFIVKIDPSESEPVVERFLDSEQLSFGNPIADMTVGPEGKLYFLTGKDISRPVNPGKIFYLDDDGVVKEWNHSVLTTDAVQLEYVEKDQAFYFSTQQAIFRLRQGGLPELLIDFNGSHFHFTSGSERLYIYRAPSRLISVESNEAFPTATPTPESPVATPTPVPGWFVLDGFGGVHGTNPDVPKPVLPYFAPFNIARDIEPDPLGRGWYMLDGYGGIHTSSPALPLPQGLPYFGFDIARNLEVKLKDGGLQFYLLDGYGTVHSTDADFAFGNLPWFGEDFARDLEPDGDGWLVMDLYGVITSSNGTRDVIRLFDSSFITPIMRSMVRFPDQRTVMMDFLGGRHTNLFYPVNDLVNGLPDNFYFPIDIIWDLETVPENLSQ